MDKALLLSQRAGVETETVEIPGVGEVTVRGLSRFEFTVAAKRGDELAQERFILAAAMVDPEMSEADVEQWQKCSPPGEINEVAMVVNRLSGIGKGAQKSGVSGVRDES